MSEQIRKRPESWRAKQERQSEEVAESVGKAAVNEELMEEGDQILEDIDDLLDRELLDQDLGTTYLQKGGE